MEELNFKIGTNKNPVLIALKEFRGRKLIDIRKFFQNKDKSELLPTKKGISLNQLQLEQFTSVLMEEADLISNFFQNNNSLANKIEVKTMEGSIGRSFDIEYNNAKTTLNINEQLKSKLGADNLDFFKNLMDCVYLSALDVIDDDDDIKMFLDVLNNKINKRKW